MPNVSHPVSLSSATPSPVSRPLSPSPFLLSIVSSFSPDTAAARAPPSLSSLDRLLLLPRLAFRVRFFTVFLSLSPSFFSSLVRLFLYCCCLSFIVHTHTQTAAMLPLLRCFAALLILSSFRSVSALSLSSFPYPRGPSLSSLCRVGLLHCPSLFSPLHSTFASYKANLRTIHRLFVTVNLTDLQRLSLPSIARPTGSPSSPQLHDRRPL